MKQKKRDKQNKKFHDKLIECQNLSDEKPEIYCIKKNDGTQNKYRRNFIKDSIVLGGAVTLSSGLFNTGCEKEKLVEDDNSFRADFKSLHMNEMKHENRIVSLDFDKDGKHLFSADNYGVIKVWNIPSGELINQTKRSNFYFLKFDPLSNYLVTYHWHFVITWSIPSLELVKKSEGQYETRWDIGISSDGILAGSQEGKINLWSIPSAENILTLEGHIGEVKVICFSPDGKILATGGQDKNIMLWSIPDGKLIMTLKGHNHWIVSLFFSTDGKTIVSSGNDIRIKIWAIADGTLIKSIRSENVILQLSSDGSILAAAGYNDIKLYSYPSLDLINTLSGHLKQIQVVSFSKDDKILASGDKFGRIGIWKLPEGKEIDITGPCQCDTVCTCNSVSTVWADESVCTCNNVTNCTCNNVCTCNSVCTCDSVCSCNNYSSGGGGGGGGTYTYWYPN